MVELIEVLGLILGPAVISVVVSAGTNIFLNLYKKKLEIKEIRKDLVNLFLDFKEKNVIAYREIDILSLYNEYDQVKVNFEEYINLAGLKEKNLDVLLSFLRLAGHTLSSLKHEKDTVQIFNECEKELNRLTRHILKLQISKEISFEDVKLLILNFTKVKKSQDEIFSTIILKKTQI